MKKMKIIQKVNRDNPLFLQVNINYALRVPQCVRRFFLIRESLFLLI